MKPEGKMGQASFSLDFSCAFAARLEQKNIQ
jgi:hypothetical protein